MFFLLSCENSLYNLNARPSQVVLEVKNLPANSGDVGDLGSIPGLGRYPRVGNSNPLQYSYLENPYGQSSLEGYSPHSRKESNMTERLSTHMVDYLWRGVVSWL